MFTSHQFSALFLIIGLCVSFVLANPAKSASKASNVHSRGQNADGTEKWAYVDVRDQAHMFYWLYYTYHPDGFENRPWILWLQGGPGASGCGYGNFEIIGPLDLELKERNTTWVNQVSVLFIDNPVGAGYSYVDDFSALTTTTEEITQDLFVVLKAVLAENPEFETRPFYIFGQSYGGKMGAHFARFLHDQILMDNIKLMLMGFAMGNAWISPIDSTLTWGPLLYWMSNVDDQGLAAIQRNAELCETAVNEERWEDATRLWRLTQVAVSRYSNNVDFYNILKFNVPGGLSAAARRHTDFGHIFDWDLTGGSGSKMADPLDALMNGPIREKLQIIPDNVIWGAQSDPVFNYQTGDFMKPVVDVLDSALKETTLAVIVYQGQLDLICDTKGAMDYVQQLTWQYLGNYNNATRTAFVDPRDDQTDMFIKAYHSLKFYWILRAGHAVPKDNADTAYRMLARILEDMDN